MTTEHLRPATVAAMTLCGRLLAMEMPALSRHPDGSKVGEMYRTAKIVLELLESLESGGDEESDVQLNHLAVATGKVWLEIARDNMADVKGYVQQVVRYADRQPLKPWVFALLGTIQQCDEEQLQLLALGFPELVGLYRAAVEVPGGLDELRELAKAP